MTHKNTRGGLPTEIPFALPTTWTPEQAFAVVELLDTLRERIWQQYQIALYEFARDDYAECTDTGHDTTPPDDPPF